MRITVTAAALIAVTAAAGTPQPQPQSRPPCQPLRYWIGGSKQRLSCFAPSPLPSADLSRRSRRVAPTEVTGRRRHNTAASSAVTVGEDDAAAGKRLRRGGDDDDVASGAVNDGSVTTSRDDDDDHGREGMGVDIVAPPFLPVPSPSPVGRDGDDDISFDVTDDWPSALHKIYVRPALSSVEAARCLDIARDHARRTGCWDEGSSGRHVNYNTVDFEVEECDELSRYLGDDGIRFHDRMRRMLGDLYGIHPSFLTYLDLFCANYEAKTDDADRGAEERGGGISGDTATATATYKEQRRKTMDRLKMHRDGSLLSFTVLLSDPTADFDGGGTAFECLRGRRGGVRYSVAAAAGGGREDDDYDDDAARGVLLVGDEGGGGVIRPRRAGDAVLHSGKMSHGGGVVRRGTRVVLVGFVDVAGFVQQGGVIAEAAKRWGRLDVAVTRAERQRRKLVMTTRIPLVDAGRSDQEEKCGWIVDQRKWLPDETVESGTGRSYVRGFVPLFETVEARADPEFQRRKRLEVEDWFLRCALLPEGERDPNTLFGGDVTIVE